MKTEIIPVRNSGFSSSREVYADQSTQDVYLHRVVGAAAAEAEGEVIIAYRSARGELCKCLITIAERIRISKRPPYSQARTVSFYNEVLMEYALLDAKAPEAAILHAYEYRGSCSVSFKFRVCKFSGEVQFTGYESRPL